MHAITSSQVFFRRASHFLTQTKHQRNTQKTNEKQFLIGHSFSDKTNLVHFNFSQMHFVFKSVSLVIALFERGIKCSRTCGAEWLLPGDTYFSWVTREIVKAMVSKVNSIVI